MRPARGFTLIELLVVISIIAILSVVGITVFTGVQKSARDAKRRGDIDAIAKAYETKYANGAYQAVTDQDFAGGVKPKDSRGDDYYNVTDGQGFKVCAALDNNSNTACNTPSTNCFCQTSTQGTIAQGGILSGTHADLGVGFPSSPSCDPTGSLLNGLVGYWKFDDNPTGTTVFDSSGNGNNGTFNNGGHWATGKLGGAGQFRGWDSVNNRSYGDFVNVGAGTSLNITDVLTVSAWINVTAWDSTNANYPYAVIKSDSYALGFRALEKIASNQIWINTSADRLWAWGYTLNPGQWWYHIAITYDKNGTSNNFKYYQNGFFKVADTRSGAINSNSNPVTLGDNNFNGLIDDVRIYNRVLSPDEITRLYNSDHGCAP